MKSASKTCFFLWPLLINSHHDRSKTKSLLLETIIPRKLITAQFCGYHEGYTFLIAGLITFFFNHDKSVKILLLLIHTRHVSIASSWSVPVDNVNI